MPADIFPSLPGDWEPTRATLHAYAQALGAVARAHASPDPRWWHISLNVTSDGLATDPIPAGDGSFMRIRMDLKLHRAVVDLDGSDIGSIELGNGLTGGEFAERVFEMVGGLGLADTYDRSRVADDDPREYDAAAATVFFRAISAVAAAMEVHRASLPGDPGPIQLWPHGFDIAFEWFGTKQVQHAEGDESEELPSQLNLGWYPAGDAYFYSNPWPFDEELPANPLPSGAVWHTEGWQGTKLAYAEVADSPGGPAAFAAYAQAVFALASPTLMA